MHVENFRGFSKNVTAIGADMNSSVHIDYKKNLILGKAPTDVLDDTTLTVEKEYYINLTEQQKKLCLILLFAL